MTLTCTSVKFEGIHCQVVVERPAPMVVVLRLAGWDAGELGDAPMQELARDFAKGQPIELFIDARDVRGASLEVSAGWSQWLGKHKTHFDHITMLTGSPFIQLTANFVRRYAELGEQMRIYTDAAAFDLALAERIGAAKLQPSGERQNS